MKVVSALLACEPSAVELLDRTFLDLVRHTEVGEGLAAAEAILLVEIERDDPRALREAVAKASEAVRRLLSLQPPRARVLRGDDAAEVLTSEVAAGEVLIVRPGERIPLDGEVIAGAASVDWAARHLLRTL